MTNAHALRPRRRAPGAERLSVVVWLVATAGGCGGATPPDIHQAAEPGDAGTQATGALANASALAVASTADLPACDARQEGVLAYVAGERALYACLDGSWEPAVLDDAMGNDGEPGEPGEQGPEGPAGASGAAGLIALAAEPLGSICPAGGTRIDVGVDDDGDGLLDAEEIDATRRVCNGENGAYTPDLYCTITENPDQTVTLRCPDGTAVTFSATATADVDACAGGAVAACGAGATGCEDGAGTFTCTCGDGYTGTGTQACAREVESSCDAPGADRPPVPGSGETCYDFLVHDVSSVDDTTPFSVSAGESYNQFYYAVPWPADTVATAYGVALDQSSLSIRAWAFTSDASQPPGTVARNVTGTTLFEDASVIGAWANGGCTVRLPEDVGLELPGSSRVMLQWHYRNATGSAQQDASTFRICTAPAASRTHRVGMTVLGTESISISPGTGQASGTCVNDSGSDITLLALDPYMHAFGTRATTVVQRAAGGMETVLDQPFQHTARHTYLLESPVVLQPGDALRTTCTYHNTTGSAVHFGQSFEQEMCFQFALSYPAGALANGVISLLGATNTCW